MIYRALITRAALDSGKETADKLAAYFGRELQPRAGAGSGAAKKKPAGKKRRGG